MTIPGDLERARHLAFAANETAAKELLLSLGSQIEQGDRDDLLLEVFAQLGEIYLVRTAYSGVEECLRRMWEILAIYSAIRAAEHTVEWRIEAAGAEAKSVVRAEMSGTGSPAGIAVRLRFGGIAGTGVLDADGSATFGLVDAQQRPMTESGAWDQDWRTTTVTIGADLEESAESPQVRERIREFARARLNQPASDAFLAEVLAAESDY